MNRSPTLDGFLNDDAWALAPPISNFTQRELREGAPATERTEVRIVYDDHAVYIGAWCYDSDPEGIVASAMKRDFDIDVEDNFEVILDTYHDKRNGFLFVVNPHGARYDALVTDEGQSVNSDWNGVWDARTTITPEGWFAEIEIPFSTLRFPDNQEQVWGVNFERNIRRKREQLLWQGWLRNYGIEKVSRAGTLTGLSGVHRGNTIEVKPYFLGGAENDTAGRSSQTKVGLDMKYSVTPTLTLDVTTLTDFAQVEVDRAQINLTRFPLFYPEKRDFFLEGAGMFDTQFGDQPVLFYSRRIGINDSTRAPIPIVGGVRLVGKANRYNLGVLTMQTEAAAGAPATNYAVARVKRDLFQQSYVGLIATNKQSSLSYNRLWGIDGAWVRSDVFGSNTLIVGGALAETVDPGVVSDNLAYRLFVDFPNNFIDHFIGVRVVQSNFDPQVGYVDRNNFRKYSWVFRIRPRPEGIGMQYIEFKPVDVDYYTNVDGSVQSLDYEGRLLGFQTKSGEYFEWNFQRFADAPHDSIDFFGNAIPPSTYWWSRWELQFETNGSRALSFFSLYSWGSFYSGTRQEIYFSPVIKLGGRFTMNLDYKRNYVQLPTGNFVANEAGTTLDYGFTTTLNVSLLAQWNNEDNELSMNFRLHWIPKIGSDVYFVLNRAFDTAEQIRPSNTTVVAKITYLFIL
ncbi:MAG: carbohydrate binding family 9 domain-containing protein [Bacteroidota bacterium]|nr:carbohydrate binding family 9 domain-containing protein [Bacteroidota bacterium]